MSRLFVENEIAFFDGLLTNIEDTLRQLGLTVNPGQLSTLKADKNAATVFKSLDQSAASNIKDISALYRASLLVNFAYSINELKNLQSNIVGTAIGKLTAGATTSNNTTLDYDEHGLDAIRQASTSTTFKLNQAIENNILNPSDAKAVLKQMNDLFNHTFYDTSLTLSWYNPLKAKVVSKMNTQFESGKKKIASLKAMLKKSQPTTNEVISPREEEEEPFFDALEEPEEDKFFDAVETLATINEGVPDGYGSGHESSRAPSPGSESDPESESESESESDCTWHKTIELLETLQKKKSSDIESSTIEKKISNANNQSARSPKDEVKHNIALAILAYLKHSRKTNAAREGKGQFFSASHKVLHGFSRAASNDKVSALLNLLEDNTSSARALETQALKVSKQFKGFGQITRRSALKREVERHIGPKSKWC